MNRLRSAFATVLLAGLAGGAVTTPLSAAPATPVPLPLYRVHVEGLACPFCAYGIEKKLSRLPGVRKVHTDLRSETVTVTMKPGATLKAGEVRKAVRAAGFTLKGFEPAGTKR